MSDGTEAKVTDLAGWALNRPNRSVGGGSLPAPVAETFAYVIRVELIDSTPPIWRDVQLASDLGLDRVHEIVQTVVGWTNSHLHKFVPDPAGPASGVSIVTPYDVEEGEPGTLEADIRLDQLLQHVGDTVTYVYDFGDNWEHTITLKESQPASTTAVRCLAGERLAPPEDVGGMSWYETLIEASKNSGSAEYDEFRDQILVYEFDQLVDEFNLDETNGALERDQGARAALTTFSARTASQRAAQVIQEILGRLSVEGQLLIGGYLSAAQIDQAHILTDEEALAATRVFRVFLDQVGQQGITLTTAGYLPPTVVIELMAALDPEHQWFGESNREVNTQPLLALRETSTLLGLTRKLKGRLLLTSRGKTLRESPRQLWSHLAAGIPIERTDGDRDIAGLGLLLISAGVTDPVIFSRELDLLLAVAGWRFDGPGRYGNADVFYRARATRNILRWTATGKLFSHEYRTETLTLPLSRSFAAAGLNSYTK